MKARRQVDEMTSYLHEVVEFARQAEFSVEWLRAWREFYGRGGTSDPDLPALLNDRTPLGHWYLFDRLDSRYRQTPVRLFVDRHPELPARIRGDLLRLEDSLHSYFQVVEITPENVTVLDLYGEPNDYYRVDRAAFEAAPWCGQILSARLFRWAETWTFHGPQVAWPERVDDVAGPSPRSWRSRRARLEESADLILDRRAWLRDRRQRP